MPLSDAVGIQVFGSIWDKYSQYGLPGDPAAPAVGKTEPDLKIKDLRSNLKAGWMTLVRTVIFLYVSPRAADFFASFMRRKPQQAAAHITRRYMPAIVKPLFFRQE